jgi:hypothetical protein
MPRWSDAAPDGWTLELDLSVPRAFLGALSDGGVDADEARKVASLEANLQMLRHRDALDYLPPPHPDAGDVAELISRVAAADPLARIWAVLNPWNGFGYADLVVQAPAYRRQLEEFDRGGKGLAAEALRRCRALVSEEVTFHDRFAFTVGWGIRGWATPDMAGLNLEQVKDDWDLLLGTLTEETFHRLQLRIVPTATGRSAASFEDLAAAETGDESLDRFYEVLAYTVLEGTANLARGDLVDERVPKGAEAGARLLGEFVLEVVRESDPTRADALINEGLRNNGPLYGLGWELSRRLADARGRTAIGAYLRRGPLAFLEAACDVEGGDLLDPATRIAIGDLADRLQAVRDPDPSRP